MGKISIKRFIGREKRVNPILNMTSFKAKLKDMEDALKQGYNMYKVDKSKRVIVNQLPTDELSISKNDDQIKRCVYITEGSSTSRMMEQDELNIATARYERTIEQFKHGNTDPMTYFDRYVCPKLAGIYTHSDDALAHFITALKSSVYRSMVKNCIDCLPNVSGKSVKIFLDKPADKIIAAIRIGIPITDQPIELGSDLLLIEKTIVMLGSGTEGDEALSNITYRLRTEDMMEDGNDIESESFEEYTRRQSSRIPFVKQTSDCKLFNNPEIKRVKKFALDFTISFPAVSSEEKQTNLMRLNEDRQIQAITRYLVE